MNLHRLLTVVTLVAAGAALGACQTADSGEEASAASDAVVITAKDFEFDMPEEISSGWNTFRFVNESNEQEHFILFARIPDDKTFAEYRSEVFQPFMDVFDRYSAAGLTREEVSQELADVLPDWYFEDVEFTGGVGLTEAGRTSQATIHLEPGTYGVECYVRTPQGTFHNFRGMFRELTVTEDRTGDRPPEAEVTLSLSSYEIVTEGQLTTGEQTIAVEVTDRPEGMIPHDINLFRLDEKTTTDEIVAWLDWMDLKQFRAPAPGVSIGGVEHLPAGATGYMTVDLEPGRYAWISEGYGNRGMVEEFTVE